MDFKFYDMDGRLIYETDSFGCTYDRMEEGIVEVLKGADEYWTYGDLVCVVFDRSNGRHRTKVAKVRVVTRGEYKCKICTDEGNLCQYDYTAPQLYQWVSEGRFHFESDEFSLRVDTCFNEHNFVSFIAGIDKFNITNVRGDEINVVRMGEMNHEIVVEMI